MDDMDQLVTTYAEATGEAEWGEALRRFPPLMAGGLCRYIVNGIPPGDFLQAVLAGDLFEALRRADDWNINHLRAYGIFLHNYAPRGCYGSRERVRDWIKDGGVSGVLGTIDDV